MHQEDDTTAGFIRCAPHEAATVWAAQPRGGGGNSHTHAQETSALIADARAQAEALIGAARAEAEQIRAVANRERAECREALRQAIAGTVDQLDGAVSTMLENAEQQMPALIMRMVEKIVGSAAESNDTIAVNMVRNALEELAGAMNVQVLIDPADEPAVRAAQGELMRAIGEGGLMIVPTPGLGRGGAIVRTERGDVDARICVQLQALSDAVISSTEGGQPIVQRAEQRSG